MESFLLSNLIMESSAIKKSFSADSDSSAYEREVIGGIEICRLKISNEKEREESGIPVGNYTTLYTDPIVSYTDCDLEGISGILSDELVRLIKMNIATKRNGWNVLVAGLGNREVTPDSLGVAVADTLNVTRHLKKIDDAMFGEISKNSLSSIACGVLGKTGVETLELVRGVTSQISPDVVIAIDALAAREYARLGAVIQLSDAGIVPGAGIGNRRDELSQKTLGIPVISVGVPTVVSAATFICDNFYACGYSKLDAKSKEKLENLRQFFVTTKDCDILLRYSARLIASAIENAIL